jgi:hypothetical protein
MILDEETAYVRDLLQGYILEKKVKGVSRIAAASVDVTMLFTRIVSVFDHDLQPKYIRERVVRH